MDSYRYLAKVYDSLMSDVNYIEWAQYLHELLSKYGVKSVLELSCGTGSMTFELGRLGYDITASDLSVDMLQIAKHKSVKMCEQITFVHIDMRRVEVGNKVDALVCVCDGPNYIDAAGFSQFADSAYNAIKPGGVLLFDISTAYKLQNVMDGQVYFDESDETACIWKNTFDKTENTLTLDVTLFVKQGAMFERFFETHTQYAHKKQFVLDKLRDAGFVKVDVFECFSQSEPSEKCERLQFVCHKV